MSKNSNIFKSLKNSVMLNCDTATLLITKDDFGQLSCNEKLRLKMHLASCKFCRRFQKQNEIISHNIRNISNPDNHQFAHKLSTKQKENLTKVIKNNFSE